MRNGCGQRAKGGKFLAITVETTMPAEKQDEKCTPARRVTAAVSGHTQPNSPPSPSRRSYRRGNGMKNARRLGAQQLRSAGIRGANSLPSQSRRPCRRRNVMKNARRLGAQSPGRTILFPTPSWFLLKSTWIAFRPSLIYPTGKSAVRRT